MLAALILLGGPFSASAAEPPKAVAAFIADVAGSVQVQRGGSDVWMLAKKGQRLAPGDQVKTQPASSCVVGFTEGSKLRIGSNAGFKLEEARPDKIAVFIGLSRLEAWVPKLAQRDFQARNPVAVADVNGAVLSMDVYSRTSARTDCRAGSWNVTDNSGRTTLLREGQRLETSAANGNSSPLPIPKSEAKLDEPKVDVPETIKARSKAEELTRPSEMR